MNNHIEMYEHKHIYTQAHTFICSGPATQAIWTGRIFLQHRSFESGIFSMDEILSTWIFT